MRFKPFDWSLTAIKRPKQKKQNWRSFWLIDYRFYCVKFTVVLFKVHLFLKIYVIKVYMAYFFTSDVSLKSAKSRMSLEFLTRYSRFLFNAHLISESTTFVRISYERAIYVTLWHWYGLRSLMSFNHINANGWQIKIIALL